MVTINSISAREILDSRGNPTIEVEVLTDIGRYRASVPSGASTGKYEALELRDNDKKRYNGRGVLKAVHNVNTIIGPRLINMDVTKQKEIDKILIRMSGKNKKNLGANAVLGVSMAVCRAGAHASSLPLYQYIGKLSQNKKFILPIPSFNILNGGRHAGNKITFQEFMIMPIGAENFKEAMKIGSEIYSILKNLIEKKYGKSNLGIGDEGGFAPNIDNEQALEILTQAIIQSKYSNKTRIAIDAAASEFFENKKYNLNFKQKSKKLVSSEELIKIYQSIIKKYNIISLEDPFEQDQFSSYNKFNKLLGKSIQIVGDDLLVTNPERIKLAIKKKACNTLLLKINQIGTITEAIEAFKLAKKAKWKVMVSHRSGETEDHFIADLALGLGAEEIKSGAPCRSERLSKYNQLIRIEESLIEHGIKTGYFGKIK